MNPKARSARRIGFPLAAGVVAVGALGWLSLEGEAPAADETAAAPAARPPTVARTSRESALTVTVTTVAPVEIERTITVNGAIHAWQEAIIGPEVGGYRVAEVHVDVGDEVEKGALLVELSAGLLEAEVATKRAVVEQREAELDNAEAALRRAETLSTRDLLAAADLDRLKSEALAARARLESSRADLQTSELRLAYTRVTAPDAGVITSRTVTVGEVAQVGNEMLRLLRQNRIEWRGDVPEARLKEIEPGQPVAVTTADGTRLEGEIRVVAPTVGNANRTGLVYVDLEPDPRVRPGMFARGDVAVARGAAIMVPLESVVSADGYSYVYVLHDDETVERRRIETGAVQGATIEVVAGLSAGERIVEKGAGFLKDGDVVDVAGPR